MHAQQTITLILGLIRVPTMIGGLPAFIENQKHLKEVRHGIV